MPSHLLRYNRSSITDSDTSSPALASLACDPARCMIESRQQSSYHTRLGSHDGKRQVGSTDEMETSNESGSRTSKSHVPYTAYLIPRNGTSKSYVFHTACLLPRTEHQSSLAAPSRRGVRASNYRSLTFPIQHIYFRKGNRNNRIFSRARQRGQGGEDASERKSR